MRKPVEAAHFQKGFTLIELSIVLVIIGFIVGGVLVGRDLIEAASIRKVISDVEQFKTAVMTFRGKYGALPGDFPSATTMLDAPSGATDPGWAGYSCLVVHVDYPASAGWSGPCNGNGNGLVEQNGGEDLQFWRHLQAANLIRGGGYTGLWDEVVGASWDGQTPGYNIPASSLGGGFSTFYLGSGSIASGGYWFDGYYGNVLYLSGVSRTPAAGPPGMGAGLLAPKVAWAIDRKIDDGKPYTGIIAAPTVYYQSGCIAGPGNTTVDAAYDLAQTAAYCTLVFKNAY